MRFSASTLALLGLPLAAYGISICPGENYVLVDPSKRPASRNCETKGKLLNPQVRETMENINSIDGCISLCKTAAVRESTCRSFGYTAETSTCVLYNKRLIDMGYRQKNTDLGTTFSNPLCYKCRAAVCPVEAVTNGDFTQAQPGNDDAAADWTLTLAHAAGAENLIYRNHDDPSNPYITVVTSESVPQEAFISQSLPCTQAGTFYQLQFKAFGINRGRVGARVNGQSVYSAVCVDNDCGDQDDGPRVSNPFVITSPNSTLEISVFAISGATRVSIDDVSLMRVPDT